ncbi:MAG: DUF5723 family protein [Bacteroidales bacterium]
MKNLTKYILLVSIMFSITVSAQEMKTAYFMQNSTLGHYMNPAFAPTQSYVGIPALSFMSINLESNVGFENFIFDLGNDKYGTFLHPNVTLNQFLDKLPDMSSTSFDGSNTILNTGFYINDDAFITVDLGVKYQTEMGNPKSLFEFLKDGLGNSSRTYDMSNMHFNINAYTELALGYSMKIHSVEGLRVGAKMKFLVGLADLNINIKEMNASMDENQWEITQTTEGYLTSGIALEYDDDNKISGLNTDNVTPNGFGIAFDLGAEYRFHLDNFMDNITLSASICDLGFLNYSAEDSKSLNALNKTFTYDGFGEIDFDDVDFDDQTEEIKDDLMDLFHFDQNTPTENIKSHLARKIYIGAKYHFMDEKMNVGILYHNRVGKYINKNEIMLSWAYQPTNWFGLGITSTLLSNGQGLGWMFNFTPRRGLNFFMGSDYMAYKISKQGIPLSKSSTNFFFGLSIPLGEIHNIRL